MFNVGEYVTVNNKFKGVAVKGAVALVLNYPSIAEGISDLDRGNFIDVSWIRNGMDRGQNNGTYKADCFVYTDAPTEDTDDLSKEDKKNVKKEINNLLSLQKICFSDKYHKDLKTFLALDIIEDNTFLAGGSLTHLFFIEEDRTKINDFDLFFTGKEFLDRTEKKLLALGAVHTDTVRDSIGTICAENYKINKITVQLIKNFYPKDVKTLIDSFDFWNVKIVMDFEFVYTYRKTIRCNRHKELLIDNINNNKKKSLVRMFKYADKGFYVSEKEITKFFDLLKFPTVPKPAPAPTSKPVKVEEPKYAGY